MVSDVPVALSVFRRGAHDSQPLHPAGAAVRVRALRSALPQEWFAAAGGDVRSPLRWLPAWPPWAEVGRYEPTSSAVSPHWFSLPCSASPCSSRRWPTVSRVRWCNWAIGSPEIPMRRECPELLPAWYRHRTTLGALRRADSRPHSYRSRPARGERPYRPTPAELRGRSSDVAGGRFARRWPSVSPP